MKRIISKTKNYYATLSYRGKLTAALLIITCFMAAYMGISSYRLSSATIYDISLRLSNRNVSAVQGLLSRHFDTAQDQLTYLLRQPAVQRLVNRTTSTKAEREEWDASVKNAVKDMLLTATKDSVTFRLMNIYFINGYSYVSSKDGALPYTDYEGALDYFSQNGYLEDSAYNPITWCGHMAVADEYGQPRDALLGVRPLYDGTTGEQRGIIVFAIDEAELYELYSGFSEKAILMHKSGRIISGGQKALLGQYMPDETLRREILSAPATVTSIRYQDHLVSFQRLVGNNAFFVLPFDYYRSLQQQEIRSFTFGSTFIALIGMLLGALFAFLFSRELSSSILSLKTVVQRVYEGDLGARFSSQNTDEIAYLGERINDMLVNINGLFEIQDQDAAIKRDLELRLMQSQINPHLLYNTLDSVIWAARSNNTAQIEPLIESLSAFFKGTLSGGSSLVSLETELNTIRHYLRIQRLAREKCIELICRVPDGLLPHPIVKLSLQPLVENALLHGFSGFRDDGEITVSAQAGDGDLCIRVTDNGIGIMPQELVKLSEFLNTYPPPPHQRHFGLYNVNRRIKSTFGNRYGLTVDSEVGHFTTVTIHMPYRPHLGEGHV